MAITSLARDPGRSIGMAIARRGLGNLGWFVATHVVRHSRKLSPGRGGGKSAAGSRVEVQREEAGFGIGSQGNAALASDLPRQDLLRVFHRDPKRRERGHHVGIGPTSRTSSLCDVVRQRGVVEGSETAADVLNPVEKVVPGWVLLLRPIRPDGPHVRLHYQGRPRRGYT